VSAPLPENSPIAVGGVKNPLLQGVVRGAAEQDGLAGKKGEGGDGPVVGTLHHHGQLPRLEVPQGKVSEVVAGGHDGVLVRSEADGGDPPVLLEANNSLVRLNVVKHDSSVLETNGHDIKGRGLLEDGDGLVKVPLKLVNQSSCFNVPQLKGSRLAAQQDFVHIGAWMAKSDGLEGPAKLNCGVDLSSLAIPNIKFIAVS